MRPTARLVAATIGLVVAVPVVALVPGTHAEAPPPAADATPAQAVDGTTRLAFTDERDGLVEVSFAEAPEECPDPDGCPDPGPIVPAVAAPAGPAIEHQGEASRSEIGMTFVSTLGSEDGDVYLVGSSTAAPTRVTCDTEDDTAIETHPVGALVFLASVADDDGNPTGHYETSAVAFASDGDGDWDIYLAFDIPTFVPLILNRPPTGWGRDAGNRPLPLEALPAPTTCDTDWRTVNVTDTDETDELWPTFVGNGRIAYSTAAQNQDAPDVRLLPDLGIVDLDWGVDDSSEGPRSTLVAGSPGSLTTTPDVAETQPAGMVSTDPDGEFEEWIAFTTTEFRTDGSIAVMAPEPGAASTDLFDIDGRPPQSSEAAWSVYRNPDAIAFTSTTNDPYGDVYVADLESRGTIEPPTVESFTAIAGGARGIGESHPAWTDPLRTSDDPTRSVAFTSRASAELIDNPSGEDRPVDGDIADVLALDGGDRRVVRAQSGDEPEDRYDEAGPSYSPDGEQMVYSRGVAPDGNRRLMVGDADGTGTPRPLLPSDVIDVPASDTDPVWSPDGTRVAFVRTLRDGRAGSAVWVFDLDSGATVQVSEDDVIDLHPTWSPDSRWIMVGRSVLTDSAFDAEEDGARRQTGAEQTQGSFLMVLDPQDPGGPGAALDTCQDGCDVDGRSPAWSPVDPGTVAYIDHGALLTVEVATAPDASSWPAEDPAAVTGFDHDPVANLLFPTESRGTVETAEDPAWSDDGTEIAFSGQPTGQPDNRGIYAINPDGTDLRTITDDRGPETEPTYAVEKEADLRVAAFVVGSPALVGGAVLITFTLTNDGPDTASDVTLATTFPAGAVVSAVAPVPTGCRDDGTGCGLARLAPGARRMYQVRVVHQAAIVAVGAASVRAATTDPDLSDNTGDAAYEFVGRLVPNGDLLVRVLPHGQTGYVGGTGSVTVVVRNRGSDPVANVQLDVTWPDELTRLSDPLPALCLLFGISCSLGTLEPGERVELPMPVGFAEEGEALPISATVTTTTPEVTADNNRDEALVDIVQPELRLLPAVARPGQVVLAYGESMPPGTEIEVAWSARTPSGNEFGSPITIDRGPFRIARDGTVRIPLLVLRRDDLGTRFLGAVSTTAAFSDLETTLLVVQRTLGPPSFTGRG